MFVNSGTRGNKMGLLRSLSAFPPFIKPGTRQTGLTGRFQKSFDMNTVVGIYQGRVKNCNENENGKRILGLMTDEEGSAFFGEGCCENVRVPSGKEKEDWRDFFKS